MKIFVEKNQEKIEEYEKMGNDKNQKLLKVFFFLLFQTEKKN